MTLLETIRANGSTMSVKQLCERTGEKNDSTLRGWAKTKPRRLRALILGADMLKDNEDE